MRTTSAGAALFVGSLNAVASGRSCIIRFASAILFFMNEKVTARPCGFREDGLADETTCTGRSEGPGVGRSGDAPTIIGVADGAGTGVDGGFIAGIVSVTTTRPRDRT